MNAGLPSFLPQRLRPPVTGRRSRRGFALLTVVPVMLLVLPGWHVREVDVEGCPKLPAVTVHSLHELVGQPTLGLNLETVRDQVEVWPGVGEVEVDFELPGTLRIRAEAAASIGSVRIGRGWHGVSADGTLTGSVGLALPPVLESFIGDHDRAKGIAVARRLEEAVGGQVIEVRRVTPIDYRVRLQPAGADRETIIHVLPQGSSAENAWSAAVAAGTIELRWADLRWTDRIVIGGAL
jgi:hypothetical protein